RWGDDLWVPDPAALSGTVPVLSLAPPLLRRHPQFKLGLVLLHVLRREDAGKGLADDLGLLVPQDALGPDVPGDDPPLAVQHEDGVVLDVLHQQAVLLLAVSYRRGAGFGRPGSLPPTKVGRKRRFKASPC